MTIGLLLRILYLSNPSKHETFTQCRFNAGPASLKIRWKVLSLVCHRLYINLVPVAADHVYQTTRERRPAVSLLEGQHGIILSTSKKHASHPRQHPASITATPADTRRWPNVVLMLGRSRRRRSNIKTTLGQRLVFAESHFVAYESLQKLSWLNSGVFHIHFHLYQSLNRYCWARMLIYENIILYNLCYPAMENTSIRSTAEF